MEKTDPRARSLKATAARYFVPVALTSCFLFSIVLAVLQPVPHGHRYDLCIKLTLGLLIFWLIFRVVPGWIFRKGLLIGMLAFGVGIGIRELTTIDPNREVVHVYASLFSTMEKGQNPYTSLTIFHQAEFLKPVYGNFNYPPLEIYPYYLAYRIAGHWSSNLLTWTYVILQSLACLVFVLMFPNVKLRYLWPFFIVFVFMEIHINSAMTLLMTALILWAIKKSRERPRRGYRYLIAVLLGLGLMTKFLIIPLVAAYYANAFASKERRKLPKIALDAGITVATALVIMAPYGIVPVFKNTILFNIILKDRAVLTTFFPNVVSGLMSWLKMGALYPVVALIILAASIWAAPKLNIYSALLAAAFTFLLVAPTPRTQYLPSVLYIVVAGITTMFGERGAIPAKVLKKPPHKDFARPAGESGGGAHSRIDKD